MQHNHGHKCTTLKAMFLNVSNSATYFPILTNHTSMESLFRFQMMFKSQFKKNDPCDCFCGPPGSQINK